MADPTLPDAASEPVRPRCPWCSAELPDANARTCPSCNANLIGEGDAQVPGVNAIDLEKLAFRRSVTPKRSRIMSWISGDLDYEDATEPVVHAGSVELPPPDVRREMKRLETAAMIADLSAEAGALATEEAVAQGTDPVAAIAAIHAELDAATRARPSATLDGPIDLPAVEAGDLPSGDAPTAAPTPTAARPRAPRIPRRKPAPPA